MIRDEYKKIQKEEKLSAREIAGIRELGERAFYTSRLPKIISIYKGCSSLVKTFFVLSGIMLIIFAMYVISTHKIGGSFGAWLSFIAPVIMLSFNILWFLVFRGLLIKKHDKYAKKIAEITNREMKKQQSIYNKLHKVDK